jgi:tetratricopeptide (TPR) repeat protein
MCYTFARVSATVHMRVEDYYQNGKRWWFRLHEKGGKRHEVPAHHNAEAYMDAYLAAAGIADEKKGPLFRSVDKHRNGFEHSIAWSMFEAAEAYRSAGDLQKAKDRETQAMRAMARVGDRYHLPIHLALLADLKAKRGEFTEADQLYDRAADVVEGMLVGSPNDQVETMIANVGDVYVGHFALAATQLRNTRRAYEVLEAARGRTIANTLRDQPAKDPPSDPMVASARKEVNHIQLALLRETHPEARSKLLDRLFEAEQILTPVGKPRTQLQEAARHPHPVDLERLQSSLRPDEVVLEYVLAEPQSFRPEDHTGDGRGVGLAGWQKSARTVD